MQPLILNEYHVHTDFHTRAASLFMFVNRWFAIRLDWMVTAYVYLTVFSCVFLKDILNANSGQVGVMLVYMISLTGVFQWCIRLSCEAENIVSLLQLKIFN